MEAACRLLAEARSIDEVKTIRDKAEAARIYARQVKLGLEAQNDAAEIRLRAERLLGELLAGLDLQDGGDAARARSQRATEVPPRLRDLGISKTQSSRWQAIASVPTPVFDQYIAEVRDRARRGGATELTTAGALAVARQIPDSIRATASADASTRSIGSSRSLRRGRCKRVAVAGWKC
jgi:hypothetical protein